MFQIVCTGTASSLPDTSDLLGLLQENRAHHGEHGITGMMLYADGTFLQVLEGPQEVIRKRYNQIQSDGRFTSVQKLLSVPVSEREFAGWAMSFPQAYLSGAPSPSEGYSTFMDEPPPPSDLSNSPSRSQEALMHFRSLSGKSPSSPNENAFVK